MPYAFQTCGVKKYVRGYRTNNVCIQTANMEKKNPYTNINQHNEKKIFFFEFILYAGIIRTAEYIVVAIVYRISLIILFFQSLRLG